MQAINGAQQRSTILPFGTTLNHRQRSKRTPHNKKVITPNQLPGNWLSLLKLTSLKWPNTSGGYREEFSEADSKLFNDCLRTLYECYRLHPNYSDIELEATSSPQEVYLFLHNKLISLAEQQGFEFVLINDEHSVNGIVGALMEESFEYSGLLSIDLIQLYRVRHRAPKKYQIMRSVIHWVRTKKNIPTWSDNAEEHSSYEDSYRMEDYENMDREEVDHIHRLKKSLQDYRSGATAKKIKAFNSKNGILSIRQLRKLNCSNSTLRCFIDCGLRLIDSPFLLSSFCNEFEWECGIRVDQATQFGWDGRSPVEDYYMDHLDAMCESGDGQLPHRRLIPLNTAQSSNGWNNKKGNNDFIPLLVNLMNAYEKLLPFKK